jgi:hypothetical protein
MVLFPCDPYDPGDPGDPVFFFLHGIIHTQELRKRDFLKNICSGNIRVWLDFGDIFFANF